MEEKEDNEGSNFDGRPVVEPHPILNEDGDTIDCTEPACDESKQLEILETLVKSRGAPVTKVYLLFQSSLIDGAIEAVVAHCPNTKELRVS